MRVELHPDAAAELRAAALWYDERRAGLGDELVDMVSAALPKIGEAPGSHPLWPGVSGTGVPVRRVRIRRFPYFLAFETHSQHVLVLAVAHAKRRPLSWLRRASQGPG